MGTLPFNFLGLPAEHVAYDTARFAILPVPYDSTTCFQAGTRRAPHAIIAVSPQIEFFDEELLGEFHECGIATLDAIEPNMSGPHAMHEDLYRAAARVVADGKFLLTLGGEHGITSALVRAVMDRHRSLSVLQIDAHLDLRDAYEGTPYSHASVMSRVLELGARVVPVGIRNVSIEEHALIREGKVRPIFARDCRRDDTWMDDAIGQLGETVYVSIDIDGFDPAYAPGTGTPEPGGLDWYQVCALLRRATRERTVVAADIVEVIPVPGQVVTEFLAARLAYKLISYVRSAQTG
jgi:agmatinase